MNFCSFWNCNIITYYTSAVYCNPCAIFTFYRYKQEGNMPFKIRREEVIIPSSVLCPSISHCTSPERMSFGIEGKLLKSPMSSLLCFSFFIGINIHIFQKNREDVLCKILWLWILYFFYNLFGYNINACVCKVGNTAFKRRLFRKLLFFHFSSERTSPAFSRVSNPAFLQ